MKRVREPELMDEPGTPRADIDASLRFIRFINRRMGGTSSLLDPLRVLAKANPGRPLTLLDIATGSADIPVAAVRWAREAGVELSVTAIDIHETTLELAREHLAAEGLSDAVRLERADAFTLVDSYGPRSFDAVHAGMFIHHLDELPALTMLRVMDRLATRLVVWNDLRRSRLAQLGAKALTRKEPHIVKHDALVSVRAAFTPREALELVRRAGWESPRVRGTFFTQRIGAVSFKQGWAS